MKKSIIHESAFVSKNAFIIGDVEIKANSSVWPFASIRGDTGKIRIGRYTNIQDNVSVHEKVSIGDFVSVGHNAVIHGCEIDNNAIIGIHATVMDNAKIGKNCIIGAKALITEGKEIPYSSLVMGVPGKIVKTLDEEWHKKIRENANIYYELSRKYMKGEYNESV
jgi:carbonic anhydrase/acetyltransferase-like protein (isoleucine patch superfamily)